MVSYRLLEDNIKGNLQEIIFNNHRTPNAQAMQTKLDEGICIKC